VCTRGSDGLFVIVSDRRMEGHAKGIFGSI
jgi:hypothetical protein